MKINCTYRMVPMVPVEGASILVGFRKDRWYDFAIIWYKKVWRFFHNLRK